VRAGGAYPYQARSAPTSPVVSPYLRTKGDDGLGAYHVFMRIFFYPRCRIITILGRSRGGGGGAVVVVMVDGGRESR